MKILIFVFLNFFNVHASEHEATSDLVQESLFACKGTDLDAIGATLQIPRTFMENNKPYTFGLNASNDEIDCPSEERINYVVNLKNYIEKPFSFSPYGVLTLITKSQLIFRRAKDFCIQSMDENSTLTVSVCNGPCENGRGGKLCIKKCCKIHKMLGYDATEPNSVTCQLPNQGHSNLNWKPVIYRDIFTKLSEDEQLALEPNVHTNRQFHECSSMSVVIQAHPKFNGEYNKDPNIGRFRLLANGDIAICNGKGKWLTFKDNTYCIDSLQNFGKDNTSDSGNLTTQVIIRCLDNLIDINGSLTENTTKSLNRFLYQVMIPPASFFLFIVIIVYSLILDEQTAYGCTIYSYCWSLFLLYITLSAQSFLSIKHGTLGCKILAVAIHFFYISTFCFLTAVNLDIFITFRKLTWKPSEAKKKLSRRFLLYVLFSVMIPTIVVSVGVFLDNYSGHKIDTCPMKETEIKLLTPRYGQMVCGVIDEALGWYIYFPVGVLLASNLIFFGMTLYSLQKTKKGINDAINGNCTKKDKPLKLFGRLFIVMGVSWIMDFVGWALKQYPNLYRSTQEFIFVFDCINILQALAIFYLFVCNKQVLQLLWRKHEWLRPLLSLCQKGACCGALSKKKLSLVSQDSSLGAFWSSRKTSIVSIMSKISKRGGTTTEVTIKPQ